MGIRYLQDAFLDCTFKAIRGKGNYRKLGGQVVMWVGGAQSTPLVDIGLTDLPKPGWVISNPAHPSPTPLAM